ncbi:unnamed protein product, partial [Amoebophrya sp. A25]
RRLGQHTKWRDLCTKRRPWYMTYYLPMYCCVFGLWVADLERCLDLRGILPDIRRSDYWRWLLTKHREGEQRKRETRILKAAYRKE